MRKLRTMSSAVMSLAVIGWTAAVAIPNPETVESFDKISATTGTKVYIEKGEDYTVSLDDRAMERTDFRVRGNTLVIECKKPCNYRGGRGKTTVTVPSLSAIDVSTGALVKVVDRFETTDNLSVSTSTGGNIDAQSMPAASVSASASTGGVARVYVTERLSASASTGGSIRYKGSPNKISESESTGGSIRGN